MPDLTPAAELRAAAEHCRADAAKTGMALPAALAELLDHVADDHTPGDVTKMYPVFEEYQVCDRCDSPHERDEVRWPCPAITHALAVARSINTPTEEPTP